MAKQNKKGSHNKSKIERALNNRKRKNLKMSISNQNDQSLNTIKR